MSEQSTMPAGRELDALIAEKVMGFQWRTSRHTGYRYLFPPGHRSNLFTDSIGNEPLYGDWDDHVRSYSTDIGTAWQVVENLREGKLDVMLGTCDGGWHCRIATGAGIPSFWREVADEVEDTAPLAICRAALQMLADKESEEG